MLLTYHLLRLIRSTKIRLAVNLTLEPALKNKRLENQLQRKLPIGNPTLPSPLVTTLLPDKIH
jgi:hypothetical protein